MTTIHQELAALIAATHQLVQASQHQSRNIQALISGITEAQERQTEAVAQQAANIQQLTQLAQSQQATIQQLIAELRHK